MHSGHYKVLLVMQMKVEGCFWCCVMMCCKEEIQATLRIAYLEPVSQFFLNLIYVYKTVGNIRHDFYTQRVYKH